MAILKTDFLFEVGKYGWSESYYLDSSLLGANGSIGEEVYNLGVLRGKLTPGPTTLAYVRTSDIAIRGDSNVSTLGLDSQNLELPNADMPWTRLLVQLVNTSVLRGRRFLGPIPDSFLQNVSAGVIEFNPDAAWLKAFQDFQFKLITGPWGFFSAGPQPPVGPPAPAAFRKINQVKRLRIVSKQTGRPFYQPRGRKWARRNQPVP